MSWGCWRRLQRLGRSVWCRLRTPPVRAAALPSSRTACPPVPRPALSQEPRRAAAGRQLRAVPGGAERARARARARAPAQRLGGARGGQRRGGGALPGLRAGPVPAAGAVHEGPGRRRPAHLRLDGAHVPECVGGRRRRVSRVRGRRGASGDAGADASRGRGGAAAGARAARPLPRLGSLTASTAAVCLCVAGHLHVGSAGGAGPLGPGGRGWWLGSRWINVEDFRAPLRVPGCAASATTPATASALHRPAHPPRRRCRPAAG